MSGLVGMIVVRRYRPGVWCRPSFRSMRGSRVEAASLG